MRPVNAQGGPLPLRPTFGIGHVLHNGQSLSIGYTAPTAYSTTQPYSNVKLYDSSGTYDITDPNASTLSLVPLTALMRPLDATGQYPADVAGETAEIAMANTVTMLALRAGYAGYRLAASITGVAGATMAQIEKGGTFSCYAAGQFESAAARRLTLAAGLTYGVECSLLTHGENDSVGTVSAYLQSLYNLQANYEGDAKALTGQTQDVPLILSQQNSSPQAYTGPNGTAPAQLFASIAKPNKVVLSGPKYQFVYTDFLHLTDYRRLGDKYGEVLFCHAQWRRGAGPGWTPLYPTAISRSGTTVTLTMNVPWVPSFANGLVSLVQTPLLFDSTVTPPHQTGQLTAWANGQGFEVSDNPLSLSITSGIGVSPITVSSGSVPHNLVNGQSYYLETVPSGNTAAVGAHVVTVIDAFNFSLNGTTGNGGAVTACTGFAPIPITSVSISGNQITMALGRAPTTVMEVGYAAHSEQPWSTDTGGTPLGCYGTLRDSDPFVGWATGAANYNWCVAFQQSVA